MLVIRRAQIEAFECIEMESFEREMMSHVQKHFPKVVEVVGQEPIHNLIHLGYERAADYGFTTRHEVCLFIDLMIMLGSRFDTDLQLPWAQKVLSDEFISDATTRIDRLYEEAMAYLDTVVGKDEVFPVRPLRSILDYRVDRLAHVPAGGWREGMLSEFQEIWPQKYRYVGQKRLHRLIEEGMHSAQAYGINTHQGLGFFLILMFLLGHRFDIDPQYVLLSEILNDKKVKAERIERFYSIFINELTKALD